MRARRIRELAPLAAAVALAALVTAAIATRGVPARAPLGSTAAGVTPTDTPQTIIRGGVSVGADSGWTSLQGPPGFVVSGPSLAVAPSDGNTAYACVVGLDSASQPRAVVGGTDQLWVTHDAGHSWIRRADPPIVASNECFVRVDKLDPSIVIVWGQAVQLHGDSTPGPAAMARFPLGPAGPSGPGLRTDRQVAVTFDGGVAWQYALDFDALSSTSPLVTVAGVTYGLHEGRLWQSQNHLNTWQAVPEPKGATGETAVDLWGRPDTGSVLLETQDSSHQRHLWWGAPPDWQWSASSATYFDDVAVQQPAAGGSFIICGALYPGDFVRYTDAPPAARFFCSSDYGVTWQAQPALSLPPVANPQQPSQAGAQWVATVRLSAVAADGSLLLDDDRADQPVLYRLTPGAPAWQPYGVVPGGRGSGVTYAPASTMSGVLWSIPIPDDFYTQLDPHDRLLSRPYGS